jgi:pimeloyl-ACP methyl ester carboxylesterase
MKRLLAIAALLAACTAQQPIEISTSQEALGGPYTVVGTPVVTNPVAGLTRTETVIQDGSASTDRFTMTRVQPTGTPIGSILLLPGQQANFNLYELDVSGDYTQALVGYLATRGYDVWGYSPRTKGIAFGACTVDGCPYMANWGLATVFSDAEYIRGQIMAATGQKPVVGGWSIGAMSTIAVVNNNPNGYRAALVWEGLLYSANASVLTGNAVNCTQAQAQYATAAAGGSTLFTLKTLAATNPSILVPIVTTPLPCPPASVPGYQLLAGDATGLAYSSLDQLVLALEQGFNDYEAQKISVDVYCSQASIFPSAFVNHLGNYTRPLMVIRTGHGFGPFMDDNLGLFGTPSTKRTTLLHSEFGHGDNYAAVNHVSVLQAPVKAWLDTVFAE